MVENYLARLQAGLLVIVGLLYVTLMLLSEIAKITHLWLVFIVPTMMCFLGALHWEKEANDLKKAGR